MKLFINIRLLIYVLAIVFHVQLFQGASLQLQARIPPAFKPPEVAEAMLVMNSCYAKYNTSEEKIAALYEKNVVSWNDNSKAKCAVLCMLINYGIVDEKGHFLNPYTKEEMKQASKASPIGEEYLLYLNACVSNGNRQLFDIRVLNPKHKVFRLQFYDENNEDIRSLRACD